MESLTGEKMDFWKGRNLHGAETRTRRQQGEDKRATQEDGTLEEEGLDGAAISRHLSDLLSCKTVFQSYSEESTLVGVHGFLNYWIIEGRLVFG